MTEPDGTLTKPDPEVDYRDLPGFAVQAEGHDLRFMLSGQERLDGLMVLIDSAKTSLKLCFYMFQADHSGTKVRAALIRAAQRGVSVHLIIDAFGSDAPQSFLEPIIRAGGKVSVFQPRWNVRYLIRNHQKFVVADDESVMTGGFNVSDHYFAAPQENGWCDLGVRITGKVVERFVEWFAELEKWVGNGDSQFFAIRRMVRDWNEGGDDVQLLLGGPSKITSAWARIVKRDLAQAGRLDLVMAYFSPPRSIRRLIRMVSRKGRARLITAGKSDNTTTIGASRALYGALLRDDVEIYEFDASKLHMKLLVIDDVTYFGSANFDLRSIRLNLELMVRVKDAQLAERMREVVTHMTKGSNSITREWHRKRGGWINRIRWRMSWFLVSVLDYTVARRLNLGL
ncbi:phosphatidylserine/phosphatidylglycerophosphate/cardiolipin synthase family protein [Altererythrobacter sp.]|uniref:phospholipase D-like domain-containing protein n=1 Tax=Altererythrobacter sp. TaxID=1872480 RepID=UPI001B0A6890|nr:phosphatidylserine/phosphatidylglycerophosphate/cardiolipin synthase family protein [Altererythrobacter sp.]MBO6610323.1 phosphatidylserine/phosphatidylglycerophosphate/cardiolipin synthase family protein [Altererythrobacter sp.]